VGTVYKTASPRFYLDAVDGLNGDILDRLETRFIGRVAETERAGLANRAGKVNVLEFMPQNQALKYMEDTDYLLLTMTNEISVPGKLFEYMATGKPILAITPPESEVDRILRATQAGISAPPDNPAAIREMLRLAFEAWSSGTKLIEPRRQSVQRYERPRLVEEYGQLMGAIQEPKPYAVPR
jgi:glycosyltransferase involved in cell wall biosynthesis